VDPKGPYAGLPDVEVWDEKRDARLYPGPHPVVAHPPCSRWCRLAGLVEARWGYKKGDDAKCFEAALNAVRRWGGVLEHPAYSDAWTAYRLGIPHPWGSWQRDIDGGWSCYVEQHRYGHKAKKATWLYAYGVSDLPSLAWGLVPDNRVRALVSWCANHTGIWDKRDRVGKRAAYLTPELFRDVLLAIARSAHVTQSASAAG
jgi:hypothetical protein